MIEYNYPPTRVVFNFLTKCNMDCKFCYCPFDGKSSDINVCKKIINKLVSWRVKSVTFGGGDPFNFNQFPELLEYTHNFSNVLQFIQIDSNGLGIKKNQYELIKQNANLIGLPVDASNDSLNYTMRGNKYHFKKIIRLLEELSDYNIPIKINTIATIKNIFDLKEIMKLISKYNVKIWSIYEFWPFVNLSNQISAEYKISNSLFKSQTKIIKESCKFTKLEIGEFKKRHKSYFIVSNTGRAYTQDLNNANMIVELGSIFDGNVLSEWNINCKRRLNSFNLNQRIRRLAT